MSTLAATATRRRPMAVAGARKIDGTTGEITYYLAAPRLSWWDRRRRRRLKVQLRSYLTDAAPGTRVFIDTPDRRGRPVRKEIQWP